MRWIFVLLLLIPNLVFAADTSVDGTTSGAVSEMRGLWGPYWNGVSDGVIIYVDDANDPQWNWTDDGGATWNGAIELETTNVEHFAVWYDKESGIADDQVHVAWLRSGGLIYQAIDVSAKTEGTLRTVDSTYTVDPSSQLNRLGITVSKSGNIMICGSTQTEVFCERSTDSGATWATRADIMETATEEDLLVLFPANTADDDDLAGLFWDVSASEISVKVYDESADSWTETSLATSMAADSNRYNMDAHMRFSDGKVLACAHSNDDSATDDLRTYTITVTSTTASAAAGADVFTDDSENAECSVVINQQNDDVYISYIKGTANWANQADCHYHLSTTDMASWGTEQDYGEQDDDIRRCTGGGSIDDDGGRVQWAFFNDDTTEHFVNLVNDIEIAAAVAGGATPQRMLMGAGT